MKMRHEFNEGPSFTSELKLDLTEGIHTGYCAIDLLDEALALNPDFQEARNLIGDIWCTAIGNLSHSLN